MAVGFDALIDVVLSEIALCGVQGAGSADFFRFVHKFYDRPDHDDAAPAGTSARPALPAGGLGRRFYEQVWKWVCDHSDTRIMYLDELRHYTLSEFEAAELHETGTSGNALWPRSSQTIRAPDNEATQPSRALSSIGRTLRQRLVEEKQGLQANPTSALRSPASRPLRRQPRNAAYGGRDAEPVFDDPESTTTAPRLYASQGRIWQALTGHGIDLKKVPSMEFVLLSLIAAQGSDGIPQPDLIRVSGQDKRSVPHRTDELARKGYIVKIPVQSGKVRTSLCVHTKFSSLTHFLGSSAQEDVYKEDSFVLSRFAYLLYNTFKDAGLVPTRELRTRMGVPMRTWNKRATQGALIRLDQTGMIKRLSVRKKKTGENWLTCIRVLRKPQEEDIMNLGFKRQAATNGDTVDDLLDEDVDGDSLIRDLEADNLEEDEAYPASEASKQLTRKSSDRIPPQWTPEQFLVNLAFDTVALGGSYGWDSIQLRDRMVGPFWRRPLESYFTRLTDDWERNQPMHLRHLAIIRDFRNTAEKKFIHYVYRTHGNFQKAVDMGVVHWAGVSQTTTMGPLEGTPVQRHNLPETATTLDCWGFRAINPREFVQEDGSATLTEARDSIVHRRSYGPRWDSAISQEIGHQKLNEVTRSMPKYPRGPQKKEKTTTQSLKLLKPKKPAPILSLTPEQRISLGLKPNGRLSKHAEKQISEHRQKTGDPCSLPDKIKDEPSRGGQPPLMSAEERKARGLPPRGRLGIKKENELRAERGLAKLPAKNKKREQKGKPEPTVLSKQQRIDLKWIDHGRLPQDLIEGLRKERKEGIALKDSKVIALYDEVMKAAKVAKDKKEAAKVGIPYVPYAPGTAKSSDRVDEQIAPINGDSAALKNLFGEETGTPLRALGESTAASTPAADSTNMLTSEAEGSTILTPATEKASLSTPAAVPEKRKASLSTASQTNKRQRTESVDLRSASPSRSTAVSSVPIDSALLRHVVENQQTSDEIMADTAKGTDDIHGREFVQLSTQTVDQNPENSGVEQSLALIEETAQSEVRSKSRLPTKITTQEHEVVSSSDLLTRTTDMQADPETRTTIDTTTRISETAALPASVVESYTKAKRPSTALALMPPDVSKLTIQEKVRYRQYTERSSPGVFLDPFARYKGLRGRPRKALIATFRLSSLSELEWFRPDSTTVLLQDNGAAVKHGDHCTLQIDVEKTSNVTASDGSKDYAKTTPDFLWIPTIGQPSLDHSSVPSSVAAFPHKQQAQPDAPIARPDHPLLRQQSDAPRNSDIRSEVVLLPRVDQIPEDTDTNHKSKASSCPVGAATVEQSHNQHGTRSTSPFRTVSGWTVVNKPASSNPPRYESPYAPTLNVDTAPQTQDFNAVSTGDTTILAKIPHVSAADPPWHISNAALRRPIKPSKPKLKTHTKRTKKQQTLGSALFFRRQIIWDIIALCKGVFPDQGEIGRPFSKLWDQRHGHVQGLEKPISSTVNETMRNMCTNPAFGIKRMVFQVRMNYKKGPYLTKKAIIAYTHLDASSPEVLKLAHNITNFSHERSQQYFPEEIRHLLDDTALYYPVPRAPKDESIVLNQSPGELEDNIKEAKKRRYKNRVEQRRLAAEARRAQNALVEQVPIKKGTEIVGTAPGRRARLASLNHKAKKCRRGPLPKVVDITNEESEETDTEEADVAAKAGPLPALIWMKPVVAPMPACDTVNQEVGSTSEEDESEEQELSELPAVGVEKGVLTEPMSDNTPVESQRGKKRVRIADPASQLSRKKSCHSIADKEDIPGTEPIDSASDKSHASFSSEVDDESDENERVQAKPKTRKQGNKTGRKRGTKGPPPTLLERLTGLTGNPNDPIYRPPDRKRTRIRRLRSWSERKNRQRDKHSSRHGSTESVEDIDCFKKLCFSLVIAASMSGEDGVVDWSIIENLYINNDKWRDLRKIKKLWIWMQTDMAGQVAELTANFQTKFLEAYEQGQVSPIEDPSTHDWAGLVRWAVRNCTYPEVPLPILREALRQFVVDESSYEILDRTRWYRDKVADRSRMLLQLQHSFVSPLHRARKTTHLSDDKALKARSWVRANTATPQASYDGTQAHTKLMKLGEPTLVRVVGDYVEKQSLRMRKLKRLLPGRNYDFTKVLARKYVRPFELSDFMTAVRVKKDMDVAFADDDPSKRFYSISRLEEDGSIAAIMTMVSEGTVKLVPQLPAVNNEFGAPLPRLSIWGFCEGDYIHRAIDRERLFWDVYVVPTANYLFGNPLMPSSQPLASTEADSIAVWPSLPEPPLPGKHNPDALLPIWSNIDGQSVTWPWWYRILNLVLQPLIFQPGATCSDIYSHCATHTTELFEIELALDWLESVNAVHKTIGGGYISGPGFWAAFGDSLRDVEGDWLSDHIKRKRKQQDKQQWREQYNLRHSTLQASGLQQSATHGTAEENPRDAQGGEQPLDTTLQILQNPKKQYEILQHALEKSRAQGGAEDTPPCPDHSPPAAAADEMQQDSMADSPAAPVAQTARATDAPSEDVDMVDADAEPEDMDGQDVDAEGEVDDTLCL